MTAYGFEILQGTYGENIPHLEKVPSKQWQMVVVSLDKKKWHVKMIILSFEFKNQFSQFLQSLQSLCSRHHQDKSVELEPREFRSRLFQAFLDVVLKAIVGDIDPDKHQYFDDALTDLIISPHICPDDQPDGNNSNSFQMDYTNAIATEFKEPPRYVKYKRQEQTGILPYFSRTFVTQISEALATHKPLDLSHLTIHEERLSDIQLEENTIYGKNVFKAQLTRDLTMKWYVYKKLDETPFKFFNRVNILKREFELLTLLRDVPEIVQPFAVVMSDNPFNSLETQRTIVRGILTEYHAGGNLEEVMKKPGESTRPWRKWALQIAKGIYGLHKNDVAHMDLKPQNIVISSEDDAILIDISGIDGYTTRWLAPELQPPWNEDPRLDKRKGNDIWAYGQILLDMVKRCGTSCPDQELLKSIGEAASKKDPVERTDLPGAIERLEV